MPDTNTVDFQSLATNPNTFLVTAVHDLGGPGLARVEYDLTAIVLDTLVAGVGASQVNVATQVESSFEGTAWTVLTALHSQVTGDKFTVGPQVDGLYAIGRYIRIREQVESSGAIYAGVKHPVFTGDVRITY